MHGTTTKILIKVTFNGVNKVPSSFINLPPQYYKKHAKTKE